MVRCEVTTQPEPRASRVAPIGSLAPRRGSSTTAAADLDGGTNADLEGAATTGKEKGRSAGADR